MTPVTMANAHCARVITLMMIGIVNFLLSFQMR